MDVATSVSVVRHDNCLTPKQKGQRFNAALRKLFQIVMPALSGPDQGKLAYH